MEKNDVPHRIRVCSNTIIIYKENIAHFTAPIKFNGSTQSISVGSAIYIVGGFDQGKGSPLCYCYQTDALKCEQIDSLIYGKYECSLVCINGIIYALGGYDYTNILDDCQTYSIASNKWSAFPKLSTPRCCPGSFYDAYSNRLYCIAGYSTKYENSFEYIVLGNSLTQKWINETVVFPSTWTPRCDVMCLRTGNDILVFGGCDYNGVECGDTYKIALNTKCMVMERCADLQISAMFYNTSQPVTRNDNVIAFDCHEKLHIWKDMKWSVMEYLV